MKLLCLKCMWYGVTSLSMRSYPKRGCTLFDTMHRDSFRNLPLSRAETEHNFAAPTSPDLMFLLVHVLSWPVCTKRHRNAYHPTMRLKYANMSSSSGLSPANIEWPRTCPFIHHTFDPPIPADAPSASLDADSPSCESDYHSALGTS